ncbi:N-acyl homoserine lactonase family protein [Methylobacterium sp. NEAU 140]|uniref:N-acyl homoserine lactonase family protein n=1 Tax=Methylobacterium sp. NEAU 140 TaxID=3064945 RepID=UPI002737381C|nr:N-acyl homoserine lactonase family protein [Methylobacterium sp. NEAU 140]MDP4024624.1 N-acyl homoserine lactonase family protein [Methylobacterium sp. NEAU 140]
MDAAQYEVYAIKYAHHDRTARQNFIGGDTHDGPMPLDYFVWVVRNDERTVIVDTGFDRAMAQRRGRTIVRPVEEGLARLGIDPGRVADVVLTHLHYDHAGNHDLFPRARFHVQEREMAFCTGRCMCHREIRQPFAAEDVKAMVDRLFEDRVRFREPEDALAPGLTLRHVGGHSDGLQVLRVATRRGWIVLASDAAHYYANIGRGLAYPIVFNLGDLFDGYRTLRRLADSDDHIIPGHDPQVLSLYPPAAADTAGWIVRVDLPPSGSPTY